MLQKLSVLEVFEIDMSDWKKMGDQELKMLGEALQPLTQLKQLNIKMRK